MGVHYLSNMAPEILNLGGLIQKVGYCLVFPSEFSQLCRATGIRERSAIECVSSTVTRLIARIAFLI